jgi:hypothetical protein
MNRWRAVVGAVCLFVLVVMAPASGLAFDMVKWGEDTELTVYGFLRNNLGTFTQARIPYAQNGNEWATARTWLRTYGELIYASRFRAWVATQFVYEPVYPVEEGSVSWKGAKEYSEYNNLNDVLREAYVEWRPTAKDSFKVGRQIVIWGEALTSRITDVIHPEDTRFSFAFSNLEDTRIPQWMARGIHTIPVLDCSFEWIVNPNLTSKDYRVNRAAGTAVPAINRGPQRFSIYPGDPTPQWYPARPAISDVSDYPTNSLRDLRYGFRAGTFFGDAQLGLMYFHTQAYAPVMKWEEHELVSSPVSTRKVTLGYPDLDVIGMYTNAQFPWPGLLRAECAYFPKQPYNIREFAATENGVVKRDTIKYMVAYDLNSFFYFEWHRSAPFDVTLEHTGTWVPNANDLVYISLYDTKLPSYVANFNVRLATNWFYNRIATDVVFGYSPWSNSGLFMPVVTFKPDWWNYKFTSN